MQRMTKANDSEYGRLYNPLVTLWSDHIITRSMLGYNFTMVVDLRRMLVYEYRRWQNRTERMEIRDYNKQLLNACRTGVGRYPNNDDGMAFVLLAHACDVPFYALLNSGGTASIIVRDLYLGNAAEVCANNLQALACLATRTHSRAPARFNRNAIGAGYEIDGGITRRMLYTHMKGRLEWTDEMRIKMTNMADRLPKLAVKFRFVEAHSKTPVLTVKEVE